MFSSSTGPDAAAGPSTATWHMDNEGGRAFTLLEEQQELASLSIKDLIDVQSDLMGITAGVAGLRVDPSADENTNATTSAAEIHLLDQEMAKLPPAQTASYQRAMTDCPGEITNERKMAFLECEDNDATLAAQRLARYWDYRLEVFGPDLFYLPMTLSGAMKDEAIPMTRHRIWQLMPSTDTGGRAILFHQPSRRNFAEYSINQEEKAMFYLFETVIQNVNQRRRGVVMIGDARLERSQLSFKFDRSAQTFLTVVPTRIRAAHMLHPDPFLYHVIFPVMKFFLGKEVRLRSRLHRGSTEHILRELGQYALPRDRLPIDIGGDVNLDTEHMNEWMMKRMALELCAASSQTRNDRAHTSNELASDRSVPSTESESTRGGKARGGAWSDSRMNRAVEAKVANPDLSLFEALVEGGFTFVEDKGKAKDLDGITLRQRKNNLCRRLRVIRKKGGTANEAEVEDEAAAKANSMDSKSASKRQISNNHDNPTDNCDSSDEDSFYEAIVKLPRLADT